MAGPKVVNLPVAKLVKAAWNYKTDGTPEQIEKLAASIQQDKSAGVPAVRKLKGGKYEVIDGNHRLDAIKKLGWKEVACEDFGEISTAVAVLIAKRRNTQWFEDDKLKYAELFRDTVLKEFDLDELVKFMPDTREDMEALSKLLNFDFNQFKKGDGAAETPTGENKFYTLTFTVPSQQYENWLEWVARVQERTGKPETNEKVLEYAIAEALSTP